MSCTTLINLKLFQRVDGTSRRVWFCLFVCFLFCLKQAVNASVYAIKLDGWSRVVRTCECLGVIVSTVWAQSRNLKGANTLKTEKAMKTANIHESFTSAMLLFSKCFPDSFFNSMTFPQGLIVDRHITHNI